MELIDAFAYRVNDWPAENNQRVARGRKQLLDR